MAEQTAERKDRILETARVLIAQRGYAGVSMRELARESRVSVPTLYKLFESKDSLLMKAVGSQFVELLNLIDRRHVESGVELALAIPEGCAREILREPKYAREVIRVFAGAGMAPGLGDMVAGELTAELEVALERARAEGSLTTWVEPRILAERLSAHQMMVCLEWASGQLRSDGLAPAMLYGACMMLQGAVAGRPGRRLLERARDVQAAAAGGRSAPRRRGSSGSAVKSQSQRRPKSVGRQGTRRKTTRTRT